MRVHRGSETQAADPLIVAKEGAGTRPPIAGSPMWCSSACRSRISATACRNCRSRSSGRSDGSNGMVRAVCLIPGASEFGYDTVADRRRISASASTPENRHQLQRATDVAASLDALEALCPNLERVSLVVSWFGDDLRAGHCAIAPRVETATKQTAGATWSVAGLDARDAQAGVAGRRRARLMAARRPTRA